MSNAFHALSRGRRRMLALWTFALWTVAALWLVSPSFGFGATLSEIEALLRSRPWCHVSTNAQGQIIGSEKAIFAADGWVTMTMVLRKGMAEMEGFENNGERVERVRWRVEPGSLSFSPDGREWSRMSLQVRRNVSGQQVILVNGDPYAPCK